MNTRTDRPEATDDANELAIADVEIASSGDRTGDLPVAGQARTLTINRPLRANALTTDLLDRLVEALADASSIGISVAVLTGAGSRFSAGFDLAELGHGVEQDLAVDDAIGRAADAIASSPMPVIAAVNGVCVGAAIELARACDIVVAHPAATFQLPATRLGLLYRPAALAALYRRLGGSAARFLVIGGSRITAEKAAQIGLVDIVAEDLMAHTDSLCQHLSSANPDATAATKRFFAALDAGVADFEAFETVRRRLLASPTRAAAVASRQSQIQQGGPK